MKTIFHQVIIFKIKFNMNKKNVHQKIPVFHSIHPLYVSQTLRSLRGNVCCIRVDLKTISMPNRTIFEFVYFINSLIDWN